MVFLSRKAISWWKDPRFAKMEALQGFENHKLVAAKRQKIVNVTLAIFLIMTFWNPIH